MLYGVFSDTHDSIDNIRKAMKVFRERGVKTAIHLGDYCAGPSLRAIGEEKAVKVIGILGNNDGDYLSIQRNLQAAGGELKGQFYTFEADGAKIACYHGTVAELTDALIGCGTYNIVLYGHTHEPKEEKRGKTYALNPGSVHGFGGKATVAILDTAKCSADIVEL